MPDKKECIFGRLGLQHTCLLNCVFHSINIVPTLIFKGNYVLMHFWESLSQNLAWSPLLIMITIVSLLVLSVVAPPSSLLDFILRNVRGVGTTHWVEGLVNWGGKLGCKVFCQLENLHQLLCRGKRSGMQIGLIKYYWRTLRKAS